MIRTQKHTTQVSLRYW